jgi:hypothetical protein
MRIRTAVCAVVFCATAAAAGAVAVTASADGATAARGVTVARGGTAARGSESPKQIAEADAASMLAAFRPPPGAQRSGPIDGSKLSVAPAGSTSPDFVTRTAWWRVSGPMDAALNWVRAHPPAGFTFGGSGSASGPSGVTVRFDEFTLPPVPTVIQQRALYVSVASDGTAGTAMRVDSQVNWLPAKSPAERIPAQARVVTITAIPGAGPGSGSGSVMAPGGGTATGAGAGQVLSSPPRPVTVTDPATVAKIAAVVDGLPLMPPGVFSCPFSNGEGLKLTFRATESGPVLAQVISQNNGCGTVTLTIGGKQMPALWGGGSMDKQVLKLAGINWAGY